MKRQWWVRNSVGVSPLAGTVFAGLLIFAACETDDPVAPPPPPEPAANVAPTVAIQSPTATTDPTPLQPLATFGVSIADPDDGPDELSFQYVFVAIADYGDDWSATEDTIATCPDSLVWSDWTAYVPDGTAMSYTTTEAVPLGFYVLAVRAVDSDDHTSSVDDAGMRRVLIRDGDNDSPVVAIVSPARDVDPIAIGASPTFTFGITDADDQTEDLSFRWAFVRTSAYGGDWDATEASLIADPGSFTWSDWTAFTPDAGGNVDVTVPVPLDIAPYVLSVQARDGSQQTSVLNDQSLRRVIHCAAVNEAPATSITVPRYNGPTPALIPQVAWFRFTATDIDNDRADLSARWALVSVRAFNDRWTDAIGYLRKDPTILVQYGKTEQDVESEWTEWAPYTGGEFGSMAVAIGPLELGSYIFAVVAKDPCGGETTVLDETTNVRRIRVSTQTRGPALVARNDLIGPVMTASRETPMVIADLFAGTPLVFEFSADATAYGGIVSGYRWGWDISDLNDDAQWDLDWTPFVSTVTATPVRTFYFGTHTLHIEVFDNNGYRSMVGFKVNFIQYTGDRDLLLVDDYFESPLVSGWDNPIGRGVSPSDDEHDAFWIDMLSNAPGFNAASDMIEVDGTSSLSITLLARYKNIIWSVFTDRGALTNLSLLHQFIEFRQKIPPNPPGPGKREINLLAMFMQAGGHMLICGEHPVSSVRDRELLTSPRYPLILPHELEGDQFNPYRPTEPPFVGDESFGYRELCIDELDYAVLTPISIRTNSTVGYCPVEGIRIPHANAFRDDAMREAISYDLNFPRLHMHDMAAGVGKFFEPTARGLNVEIFNPQYFENMCPITPPQPRFCLEPIYGLHCLDSGVTTYGEPVAFWSSAYAQAHPEFHDGVAARSAVFGFSPVFFEPEEVRPGIEYILFDEWQLPRSP